MLLETARRTSPPAAAACGTSRACGPPERRIGRAIIGAARIARRTRSVLRRGELRSSEAARLSPSCGLRRGLLGARRGLGAAAHIDAGAVAAGDFRIGEARDQHAAVERDDLAVALAARRLLGKADVVLAVRAAFEQQLGRLRLVGKMHHDAAARAAGDVVGLAALAARRGFGAAAVGLVVIGGKAPAADQVLRRDARRKRRAGGRRRGGLGRGRDRHLRGATREQDRRKRSKRHPSADAERTWAGLLGLRRDMSYARSGG